jgi:hypothetical protein
MRVRSRIGELAHQPDLRVFIVAFHARRDEQARYSLSIHIGANHHQGSAAPTGDCADGLSGGPDFWEVSGARG